MTSIRNPQTNLLIRHIVEHTHAVVGREYFRLLVKHLAEALQVSGVWVTEYHPEELMLKSLAFWFNGDHIERYEYSLPNTPCERVVHSKGYFHVPDKVIELFPYDPDLAPMNAVSYMGLPLLDQNQTALGHIAILHNEPLYPTQEQIAIFHLFAQRASAEFSRVKAEEKLAEKELRLSTLVNNIRNAILEIDLSGCVTYSNPAANNLFGAPSPDSLRGTLAYALFDDEGSDFLRETLKSIREDVNAAPSRTNKNLYCITLSGESIPVEASVCHYSVKNERFVTLVLNDLKELRRAEQRLQMAEEQQQTAGIAGQSRKLKKAMEDAALVAKSNSTILLLGESGTGKEVFARYIYEQSERRNKPFIKVNCAAIPTNLIESEFFGHEKGAFTGAFTRREGRFSLADNGTLFLDEVGELPIDMQAKLLRVLQEGEFEPVGSTRTLKVNVRIIAATNRDLAKMVKVGTFREDLYYRLNVIPIALPPLRERGDDVITLANLFIRRFAREVGKEIMPLDDSEAQLLLQYSWPGNIRELEHVIERAVVLSRHSRLDLHKFIPLADVTSVQQPVANSSGGKILTIGEIQAIERQNITRALNQCGWKISGANGAAQLLGIPPSTLHSKIKVLNITKD